MANSYASASGGAAGDTYKPQYLQNDPMWNPLQGGVNQAGMTSHDALTQSQGLLRSGGPGSEAQIGPNGEVTTTLKGADPFASRLASLSQYGLLNSQQGGSAGTSEPAHVGDNSGVQGNEGAARAAAFAQGKDRAALIAQKGLEGVKNLFASRGIGGSTMEGEGLTDVFAGATNTLGNLNRDITMADASRAGQLADRNYAGNITQRGQDIDYRTALEQAANSRNASLIGLVNAAGAY